MRVTAGRAKGRELRGPPGARPSSGRVRAALFSALAALGADLSRVLDLYAGSGALGIEALSRGAGSCDFVDESPAACRQVRRNLESTGLSAQGRVHCLPVEKAPERLRGPYTLVLADPPYGDPSALGALERVAASPLVEPGRTVLVLEHSSRAAPPERLGPLELTKTLRHGDSALSFYR
ncbi:Ribosomal RNA small subunit methyltransferase D [bacterium HR24]|nr:Ribosomal RNA small subunit methyltransferase D [bacterium HR24]